MDVKYRMLIVGLVPVIVGGAKSSKAQTCRDNGGLSPYVCVDWGQGADPEELTDFRFDFTTDAANPGVTLLTGDSGWVIWSQVSSTNTAAANLGAVTLDPSLPTDNFTVTIANGTGAGAANMGSMDLTKKNGWNGFSSIAGGTIAGDLTGILELQQDSNGGGGDISANFVVGQNVLGAIIVPVISGAEVTGSLTGNLTVQQGSERNHSGAANAS